MLTAEQIEARRAGIGGSDIAAVLGVSPWQDAIDVFFDKRPDLALECGYLAPTVEGDAVDFGQYVEEPIAQLYCKKTGHKVRRRNVRFVHKSAPWLAANIDRDVVGLRKGLEIKSVNWRVAPAWGESGSGDIAEYYLPQVHQYMLVMDYDSWDVAALIGGATDFRVFHVERDREMDEIILDTSRDFWLNHVEAGVPPSIDWTAAIAPEVIKRVYTLVNDQEVTLPAGSLHIHESFVELSAKAKEYDAAATVLRSHLAVLAGNAGVIRIDGLKGAYVRKVVKRAGYTVEPSEYVDFRYSSRKG